MGTDPDTSPGGVARRGPGAALPIALLALPLAALAADPDPTPLELCRDAFTGEKERFEAPFPPGQAPRSPDEVLRKLDVATLLELEREENERSLALLRRAADLGHLPSRYHLATFSVREGQPAPGGMLDPGERERLIEELARLTFPYAEEIMAFRTKDEGFFPNDRFAPGFDAHAAALKRWNFFVWMTRSALHGNRMAWEHLAEFYAVQIENFESSPEDRVRGYAWEHLRSLPVYDWEKNPARERWVEERRKQRAWQRLRGPEEQARAEALAAHYEKSIFPHVLSDRSREAICAVEPQFEDASIAARRIADPVGPAPEPPPPSDPQAPRRPVAKAPEGMNVVSRQIRLDRDVEPDQPLRLAEIAPEQAGLLGRVVCDVHAAPIFEREDGGLAVFVDVLHDGGRRERLCQLHPTGPQRVARPLGMRSVRLRGGEVVEFSCSSYDSKGRVRGEGCAVDVELWIRVEGGS